MNTQGQVGTVLSSPGWPRQPWQQPWPLERPGQRKIPAPRPTSLPAPPFSMSDAGSFVSGIALHIDGGMSLI
jgi:hypothetical protein